MAQASHQIRGEIEDTRERLGDTVDALAYKANVPKRTKNWLGEKKDAVTSAVTGHTPDGQEVKGQMQGMKRTAERNPLGLAIAGAACSSDAAVVVLENLRFEPGEERNDGGNPDCVGCQDEREERSAGEEVQHDRAWERMLLPRRGQGHRDRRRSGSRLPSPVERLRRNRVLPHDAPFASEAEVSQPRPERGIRA
jgi:hypothetical protein